MAQSPLFDIYDPYGVMRQQAELGIIPPTDEEEFQITGAFPRRRRRPSITDLMPEEEKKGMLRSLAEIGSSGLTGLGWLLDTPGAIVRGTISGLADGDPLKGIREIGASSDERTSGRDLLRQFGMVGNEDTWSNFGGGVMAEMALDPLTYLNPLSILGRGAYGAAGKAAQRAGLLDDAALLAKQKDMGIREFLRKSTPQDLIDSVGGDAAERFSNAAKGVGRKADDLLGERMAGLMEARLPFTDSGYLFSGGKAGDWLAGALDQFGEGLKRAPVVGSVVNRTRAAFDPTVMGEVDPDLQWTMRRAHAAQKTAERGELERLGALQYEALQAQANHLPDGLNSFSSQRIQNAIRDLVEAGGDTANLIDTDAVNAVLNVPQWRNVYEDFAARGPDYYQRAQDLGLNLGNWSGRSGDRFFPSQSVWFNNEKLPDLPDRLRREPSPFSRGNRVLGLDENFSRARDPAYDFQNRAQTFRRLMAGDFGRDLQQRLIKAKDTDIPQIMDEAFASLQKTTPGWQTPYTEGMKEIQDLLNDPTLIPADRVEWQGKLDNLVKSANAKKVKVAELLRKADTQFADNGVGLFDESSFDAMSRYAGSRARVESNAGILTDELLKGAKDQAYDSFPGGGWMRLDEAAKQLGFDPENFKKAVQASHGTDITNLSVNEKLVASLKKLAPQRDLADDGVATKAWNTFTNAFKIGALANPAYHTRNLYSGQIATLTAGLTNPIDLIQNAYAGWRAGKGDYTSMLNRIRKRDAMGNITWAAPGFEGLSDDAILKKLMSGMSRNRLGGGAITDLNMPLEQATAGLFPGAAVEEVPYFGKDGLLWDSKRSLQEWLTTRGVDWAGLATDRGVPNRTTNPWLRLHERVGQQVEDANRFGAYLSAIRKGYSPDAAADLVFKTQVDYSPRAFSDYERKIKQWVPFYSYQRGIAPLVAENLLYRPGGLQGQAIRTVSRGSEPNEDFFTPEYLRQSAAIPLAEALGGKPAENLQRFVTNIDLPFEGLINLFSPGVGNNAVQVVTDTIQKTGTNLLGQLNPIVKAPLEMALNRQLYTGRELSDLYSVLERDIGTIGRPLEQVFNNFVPGGTKMSSIYRTATDERLTPAEKAMKLLVNNTLGLKVTDVDQERTKRLAARNTLNELLSTTPGVRTYENITVPPEVLQAMPQNQQRMYLLYKIIQNEAAKRARDKKKAAMDPMQLLGITNQF